MEHRILLLIALLSGLGVFGQVSSVKSTILEEADIPRSTLYILPTGNEKFDKALVKAVHEIWTLTPIGDYDELEEQLDLSVRYRLFIGYLDGGLNHSIAVIRGGTNKPRHDLGKEDVLASSAMGSVRNENTIEECAYRIPLMVAALQQVLSMRIQQGHGPVETKLTIPNAGGSVLMVERALLRDAEFKAMERQLGRNVWFVDRADVEDAIELKQPNTLLFVPVHGRYMDMLVYDLGSSKCVHFERFSPPTKNEFKGNHIKPLGRLFK